MRIALGRVANDAVSRFVSLDEDLLDLPRFEQFGIGVDQVDNPLKGARRLVLVEPKLKVHPHYREVISGMAEHEIERRIAARLFKLAEHRFRIAEDILRTNKAVPRALHR